MKRFLLGVMFCLLMVWSLPAMGEEHPPLNECSIYVLTAEWCGPCKQMHKEAWPWVVYETEKYKAKHVIDIDQKDNKKYVSYYEVEALPAILIIENKERKLIRKHEGFMNVDKLRAFLRKHN